MEGFECEQVAMICLDIFDTKSVERQNSLYTSFMFQHDKAMGVISKLCLATTKIHI